VTTAATPAATAPPAAYPAVRRRLDRDDILMRGGLLLLIAWMLVTLVLPLWSLLSKSFQNDKGEFVGLANYLTYFSTPALFQSLWNSVWVSLLSTAITVTLAFLFAYGLTRTCMPLARLFRAIAQVPILAPSLLPGISLIYLFGNQGMLKSWLLGDTIYGPIGIVIGEVFYTFPHALMILITALSLTDARLYEASESLGAGKIRTFFTVTLPSVKYGLISAIFVVFTLVITDFGVPKVIGGKFNMLATDIYKQVIGQQNFSMGAVVAIVLLAPAVLAFFVDRFVARKQMSLLSARAVPYAPKPKPARDYGYLVYCAIVGAAIIGILAMAAAASFMRALEIRPKRRNSSSRPRKIFSATVSVGRIDCSWNTMAMPESKASRGEWILTGLPST